MLLLRSQLTAYGKQLNLNKYKKNDSKRKYIIIIYGSLFKTK